LSFDITLAFDNTSYLDKQFRLFIPSLKNNIPDDTIIHIVTNRDKDDNIIKSLMENFNTKYYYKRKNNDLKSRCRYMLNCFDVDTDKEWLIKMESDFIIMKHLNILENILDSNYDIVIEPENRYIFGNPMMRRIYKHVYKSMNIKCPIDEIIEYRENKEKGLPLFGTGMVCVKPHILPTIRRRWKDLTKKCEPWIDYNTHPNEMAFTGMVYDEGWKWNLYPDIYKYNPIGHFRRGPFPSIDLIDKCYLPEDVIIFDYHRFPWLFHVAQRNKKLFDIIKKHSKGIKDSNLLSRTHFLEGE
jgi:hypothetical protein